MRPQLTLALATAAAAVVLVGVVGITVLPDTVGSSVGAPGSAGPSPSPGSRAIPSESSDIELLRPGAGERPESRAVPVGGLGSPLAARAGRYHIDEPLAYPSDTTQAARSARAARVSFDLPAGWTGDGERDVTVRKGELGSPSGLALDLWQIDRVYLDPCRWVGAGARGDDVALASTGFGLGRVDRALTELWGGWADDTDVPSHAGFAATAPTVTRPAEVTLAGLDGRYLAVRAPSNLDIATCDGGEYVLWRETSSGRRHLPRAGELDQLWILDLDGADSTLEGGLLVVHAASQEGASADDLAELQAVVDSIEVELVPWGAVEAPGPLRGLVAFSRYTGDPDRADPADGSFDSDIYLVGEDGETRRIIGSESETLDQVCPAFSADGERLAFGQAEGTYDAGYRNAALGIVYLGPDGMPTQSRTIDIGGTFDPPCATWSPDGRRLAFRAITVAPNGRPPGGREVWVVTLPEGQITVLPDVLAGDLEWSPDGSLLAIAEARADAVRTRGDERVRLWSAATGELTTLAGPAGVEALSWSPDGSRIALQRLKTAGVINGLGGTLSGTREQEIWVVRADGSGGALQTGAFEAIHGTGPAWSPAGDRIAYQRVCARNPADPVGRCREQHEAVLLRPGTDTGSATAVGSEVVLPPVHLRGLHGDAFWFPYSLAWSPDGGRLLYLAWGEAPANHPTQPVEARCCRGALIAVPVDSTSPPTLLHEGYDIGGTSGQPWRPWGRGLWE